MAQKLLVVALVGLFVLCLALIWIIATLAQLSLWIPAGITLGSLALVAVVFAVRAWKARRAAKGLDNLFKQQAKAQAQMTRPDLRIELQHMQGEFDKAVAALKKRSSGREDALYRLPWYAIIGPPGAGKSTALRNSGLRFPNVQGRHGSVKGIGGTRNCDWWLANEGIVLDTAGRWATQDEDHEEWSEFLGMLKRYRPRKPLNGLITAISVGDIVNARDEEVEDLARRMRARIDEVIGQLGVSLPIYVMFTKCDLVAGFVEMFSDLRRSQRGQVWGFTVPLAQEHESPEAYTEAHLAQLSATLESRALGRMVEERGLERRRMIYGFPQQFSLMRRSLSRFVGVLFEPNSYQETPVMRGLYFTSGTQEGRPFNLLLGRLMDGVGVGDRHNADLQPVDQKSYFLHDAFTKVIFQDKDLASASQAELKRIRVRRMVLTGALSAAALCFSVVPGYAWVDNRNNLRSTEAMVAEFAQRKAPSARQEVTLEHLQQLIALRRDIARYSKGAPEWLLTLGMYQGDRIREPLDKLYKKAVRDFVAQPVVAGVAEDLTEFGFRYTSLEGQLPTPAEQAKYQPLLKLLLLLSDPKEDTEPQHGKLPEPWIVAQLTARLVEQGQGVEGWPSPEQLTVIAEDYASCANMDRRQLFARDVEVVSRARLALTRTPLTQQMVDGIVRQVAPLNYDLSLERMIGQTSSFFSAYTVRGAFTRRGWENVVRALIEGDASAQLGELWVLGLADEEDARLQHRRRQKLLASAYFSAYINEWEQFIRGVRVKTPTSHAEALARMRELTGGGQPPLSRLLHKVDYNVHLEAAGLEQLKEGVEQASEGSVDRIRKGLQALIGDEREAAPAGRRSADRASRRRATDQISRADVAARFVSLTRFAVPAPVAEGDAPVPVTFDRYQEQLHLLRDALQLYIDNPREPDELMNKLRSARVEVQAIVDQQVETWRPVFMALLWPPIEGAAETSEAAVGQAVSDQWCDEIFVPYARGIEPYYPFDARGNDLPLEVFSSFYSPTSGLVERFVQEDLGRVVIRSGDTFAFAQRLGTPLSKVFSLGLLDFLGRTRDVGLAFFPIGATEPRVDMEVQILPSPGVHEIELSSGGRRLQYINGRQRWVPIVWPGAEPAAGATLVVRGANGLNQRVQQDGAWGLFRLIEAGQVTRTGAGTFRVAWHFNTHDITVNIDFRTARAESPFFGVHGRAKRSRFLEPLRTKGVEAPRKVLRAGRPCRRP